MIKTILEKIKNWASKYKESSSDLQIMCPYCGGSKRKKKPSLYISKTPLSKYKTYMFHCFRASCKAKGTLYQLVCDLGILDQLSSKELVFLLSNIYKSEKKKFFNEEYIDKSEKFYLEKESKKLDYIKKRLGLEKIPSFIEKDIVTFFPKDHIRHEKMVDFLNSSFVGFLTYNKNKIVCRNITQNDFRYYNIFLKEKIDFYMTSPKLRNIDLLSKGFIVIAEGIFSVLRGYFHLISSKYLTTNNVVLLASLGGKPITYLRALNYCVHTFGIPDWDIIILSDSEISVSHYTILKNETFNQIKILYNSYGEDFGSEKCKIITTRL